MGVTGGRGTAGAGPGRDLLYDLFCAVVALAGTLRCPPRSLHRLIPAFLFSNRKHVLQMGKM